MSREISAVFALVLAADLLGLPACALMSADISRVKCIAVDRKQGFFEQCQLKLIQRGVHELNLAYKLLKGPVDNVWAHVQVLKRSNGYKPYLINMKIDACKFLKNRKNFAFNFMWGLVEPYFVGERQCPFIHDLYLNKMRVNQSFLMSGLLPTGDFCANVTFLSEGKQRVVIEGYFSFTDTDD